MVVRALRDHLRRAEAARRRQVALAADAVRLQAEVLDRLTALTAAVEGLRTDRRRYDEVQRFAALAPVIDEVQRFAARQQLDCRQTLVRLAECEESLARFGDGELRSMLRAEYTLGFQRWSGALARDLRAVFARAGEPGLLVGFPFPYRDLHWSAVWLDLWPDLVQLLPPDVTFGTTHVTRPLCFKLLGAEAVDLWRRVWAGRDVVLVTGRGSRFHRHPRLFDTAASWTEVLSTPKDAHDDLPRLLDVLDAHDPSALHLVALGPAGTVLAAELGGRGRRALDIGHLSGSYATAFEGAAWPERLPLVRQAGRSGSR